MSFPVVYRYLMQRPISLDVLKLFLCERSYMPTATTTIVFINFQLRASIFRLKLTHQKQLYELKSAHGEAYCPDLYRCIIILPLPLQYIFLSWCQVTEVRSVALLTKDEEAVGLTPYSTICSVERKVARFPDF